MKNSENKIDPTKYYNLSELLEFIPWIDSLPTLKRWLEADLVSENNLKAIKVGKGTATRYHIKGENIINFLAKAEDQGLQLGDRKEVVEMEEETNVDEVNKEISEAQADEEANGVDKSEEMGGTNEENNN